VSRGIADEAEDQEEQEEAIDLNELAEMVFIVFNEIKLLHEKVDKLLDG
jgi:hypothetical protein